MHRETDVSRAIFEATGGGTEVVEKATDFAEARLEVFVIMGDLQGVQSGITRALKKLSEIEQRLAKHDAKAQAGKASEKPKDSDESTYGDTAHTG